MERVVAYRERVVAFANFVSANYRRYEPSSDDVQRHLRDESAWLSQEYGRITPIIGRYGQAGMHQYGMIVSQDVVRDAIQSPDHPGYSDVAQMAIGHVDMIIGQLRAEVEESETEEQMSAEGSPPPASDPWDSFYRATSPLYWVVALGRRLLGTAGGKPRSDGWRHRACDHRRCRKRRSPGVLRVSDPVRAATVGHSACSESSCASSEPRAFAMSGQFPGLDSAARDRPRATWRIRAPCPARAECGAIASSDGWLMDWPRASESGRH